MNLEILFGFLSQNIKELGMLFNDTLDLTFKQQLCPLCKKVNNQFSVMTRFGKLMSTETVLSLDKALILRSSLLLLLYWCGISLVDKILINWTF